MEEWIRQEKILFPNPTEEREVVWGTLDTLLSAIEQGGVPVTPKKKNPLLTRDTPNLEFWVGKVVGFGRPTFKKHWIDLKSHVSPVGSWIARMNEDSEEEEFVTLRSREAGEGTAVVEKIFGRKVFSYPKPPSLIRQLVAQTSEQEDIVLDFFAGSGTTAQAVLEQNIEDGFQRRFIMISNAEATADDEKKNLCQDVCAPRIEAVIEGFGLNPPTGGDFAYLRTRRIPVGSLLEIEHSQVWTALQLAHRDSLTPFTEATFLWAGDENEAICYVPRFRKADAPALLKAVQASSAVTLYSWQPQFVRQHVPAPHVTHLPIPETLALRFGLHKGAKR